MRPPSCLVAGPGSLGLGRIPRLCGPLDLVPVRSLRERFAILPVAVHRKRPLLGPIVVAALSTEAVAVEGLRAPPWGEKSEAVPVTLAALEEPNMGLYLTRFSYTPETWSRMMKNPEDRRAAASQYIESVGGKLLGFWFAFGEHDAYNLWEAPDNVSMAAVAIAISGGGALSKFETTPLMTMEETLEALGRAGDIAYRPPGS